jgi:hypothetical protein
MILGGFSAVVVCWGVLGFEACFRVSSSSLKNMRAVLRAEVLYAKIMKEATEIEQDMAAPLTNGKTLIVTMSGSQRRMLALFGAVAVSTRRTRSPCGAYRSSCWLSSTRKAKASQRRSSGSARSPTRTSRKCCSTSARCIPREVGQMCAFKTGTVGRALCVGSKRTHA